MPGLGEHREAGVGSTVLSQMLGWMQGSSSSPANDQHRQVELPKLVLEVVERGPLALVLGHGVGRTDVGVLGELLHELGEAARVLLLEARAGRVGGEAVGVPGHAFLGDAGRRGRRILPELIVALAARARADAGQGERQCAVGMEPAETRRRERALRQADDMRLGDPEMVEHVQRIGDGERLAVHLSPIGSRSLARSNG